jgi:hypothetical protein
MPVGIDHRYLPVLKEMFNVNEMCKLEYSQHHSETVLELLQKEVSDLYESGNESDEGSDEDSDESATESSSESGNESEYESDESVDLRPLRKGSRNK